MIESQETISGEQAQSEQAQTALSSRPVTGEDAAFLLELYASTRELELSLVPWDTAQKSAFVQMQFNAQQQHYAEHYPNAVHELLLCEGESIGKIHIARNAESIHILDFIIAPPQRRRGIGTMILKELQHEAAATGKSVRGYVEVFNPALRLFEKLGFSKIEETGYHRLLEWRPDFDANAHGIHSLTVGVSRVNDFATVGRIPKEE
jgi:ribosomal protein S18 acetylase RimI-like enzyme